MSTRAEQRRAQKAKNKTPTYNLTEEQLDLIVRAKVQELLDGNIERIKQEAADDAVNVAMTLMLSLPMKVLMD